MSKQWFSYHYIVYRSKPTEVWARGHKHKVSNSTHLSCIGRGLDDSGQVRQHTVSNARPVNLGQLREDNK